MNQNGIHYRPMQFSAWYLNACRDAEVSNRSIMKMERQIMVRSKRSEQKKRDDQIQGAGWLKLIRLLVAPAGGPDLDMSFFMEVCACYYVVLIKQIIFDCSFISIYSVVLTGTRHLIHRRLIDCLPINSSLQLTGNAQFIDSCLESGDDEDVERSTLIRCRIAKGVSVFRVKLKD